MRRFLKKLLHKIKHTKDVERVNPNIKYDFVNNCNLVEGEVVLGKCKRCGKTKDF